MKFTSKYLKTKKKKLSLSSLKLNMYAGDAQSLYLLKRRIARNKTDPNPSVAVSQLANPQVCPDK